MTISDDLRGILAYNKWANDLVLKAVQAADPATQTESIGAEAFGILQHLASAQDYWYGRLADRPVPAPQPELDTVEQMRACLDDSQKQMEELLASGRLAWDTTPAAGINVSVGTVVIQMHGHGVQHRAEIGILLNLLGHSPGNLDYLAFALSNR